MKSMNCDEEDVAVSNFTELDGVDAVLTGHNHALFPGDFKDLANVNQGTRNNKRYTYCYAR